MKGIAGQTGYITRTQPFGHTLFLGHISFSDQDLVAFTPSFFTWVARGERAQADRATKA